MEIGKIRNFLIAERRAIGWTQEELAERSGVSVRTIRNLETGVNTNPRRTSVELLLAAFNTEGVRAAATFTSVGVGDHAETPLLTRVGGGPWRGISPVSEPLIGRDRDLRSVVDAMRRSRLLVLTGPTGVGKTRLALAAAAELRPHFRDGVAAVELSGLRSEADDEEQAYRAVHRLVESVAPLRRRADDAEGDDPHLMLVLDNAEHLVKSVSSLCRYLLGRFPRLHVVVTSRRSLSMMSADTWEVNPLATESATAPAAVPSSAAELFLRRACSRVPTLDLADRLALVSALCRRLEGLPLAIELAARRLRSIPLDDLVRADRLLATIDQQEVGGLPHQRSLSDRLRWSYDLLDVEQRTVLHHLAARYQYFSFEDLVCSLRGDGDAVTVLGCLVDASMVQVHRGRHYEYQILTVVREFVNELGLPLRQESTVDTFSPA